VGEDSFIVEGFSGVFRLEVDIQWEIGRVDETYRVTNSETGLFESYWGYKSRKLTYFSANGITSKHVCPFTAFAQLLYRVSKPY
jgi:hypothetical protein